MRVVNEYVVGLAEDMLRRRGRPVPIIYSAPTGYGKTCTAPRIYVLYRGEGLVASHIHVLPMRSLVEKVYGDMRSGRGCYSFLHSVVPAGHIGYQSMDRLSGLRAPFFLSEMVVSTIDSYLYNLFRIPVAEHGQVSRHYAAPRLPIFTGLNVLDEAHLYGGDPGIRGDAALFAAYTVALEAFRRASAPALILSATLPSGLINYLAKKLGGDAVVVEYEPGPRRSRGGRHVLGDEEFDSMACGVKWVNRIIGGVEAADVVAEHASMGRRVLVVRNTPEKAAETYQLLMERGVDAVLIHGRMSTRDRRSAMGRIAVAKVLVATQVVEAGIDVSFDVLVSDVAAPSALVQRAGRINRWFREQEAYVYIIRDAVEYSGMYSGEAMGKVLDFLAVRGVNWRYAGRKCGELYGYKAFLDETSTLSKTIHDAHRILLFQDLISTVAVSNMVINRLLGRLCDRGESLVRSSLMVPVYVGGLDDIAKGIEAGDVVAVSLQYAVSNADNLRWSDGGIRLIYSVGDGGYRVSTVRELGGRMLCREMLRYGSERLVAVAAPPGLYSPGLGLLRGGQGM